MIPRTATSKMNIPRHIPPTESKKPSLFRTKCTYIDLHIQPNRLTTLYMSPPTTHSTTWARTHLPTTYLPIPTLTPTQNLISKNQKAMNQV